MSTPDTHTLFSHRADEEPVTYPTVSEQADRELNAPFEVPQRPDAR